MILARARSRSPLPPPAAWLLALALCAAEPVRAQGLPLPTGPVGGQPAGPGPRDYPDGGTIRAGSVLIPNQLREEREPDDPPRPASLLSLGAPDVLAALGSIRPEVGAWAEYAVRESGREVGHVLVSVLPPPMPDGLFWLEIDVTHAGAIPAGMRMLSRGDPQVRGNLERVILSFGGQTMYEVPPQSIADQRKSLKKVPESGARITTTPGVTVRVKTGAYTCDRIRIVKGKEVTQVWRSAEVPLFGLVRSETGVHVTELIATGHTGAHTLIPVPILDEALPPEARAPAASGAAAPE